MNADLLMGEELKKTGAGNLFTVFGEPDIELRTQPTTAQVVVELNGVDVYDPTTGEIRSDDTEPDRAVDDRHQLQRGVVLRPALLLHRRQRPVQAAEDGAEGRHRRRTPGSRSTRTESRPFDKPETGKIAVKVINDYGDEVMKVFEV